jgi:hypothetical protein
MFLLEKRSPGMNRHTWLSYLLVISFLSRRSDKPLRERFGKEEKREKRTLKHHGKPSFQNW